MKKIEDWSGICPATNVVWKDKSCRKLDEEGIRMQIRDFLEAGAQRMFFGTAHEGLSMEERLKMFKVAVDEVKGRVQLGLSIPESGWTWMAIEQGKAIKDAGADFIYVMPPIIYGLNPDIDDKAMVDYYRGFDKEIGAPYIGLAVPNPAAGTMGYIPPKTLKTLAMVTKNLVAFKLECMYSVRIMHACVSALREAEKETGRHVCALLAGDHGLAEATLAGFEGNVNSGGVYRVREDLAIFNAINRGDLNEAFSIQSRLTPSADAVRGVFSSATRTYTHFPYRFKVCAWLTGKIPTTYMRAPLLPVPKEEVEWLRDALIKSGFKVVREAQAFEGPGI
jgi:dihydrodipicolinate synthase/N-acetylneuraminate lyase